MDKIAQLWRELYERGGPEHIRALVGIDTMQAKAIQYGLSLLHIAAGHGYSPEALLLLESGADVNLQDTYGDTPLHRAAANSDPTMCRILLEHGASLKATNQNGQTPVDCAKRGDIWAWREDHDQTIKMLEEFSGVEKSHDPEKGSQ